MQPDAMSDGLNAVQLSEELEALAQRVGRFLGRLKVTADEVELWMQRTSRWGWRLDGRSLEPDARPAVDRICFRVFRDGRLGHASTSAIDDTEWRRCVEDALNSALPSPEAPPAMPRARRPGPMTFDADLADLLAPSRELHRIAFAMSDNLWHEADRILGVDGYAGSVSYGARRFVVGTRNGVVASLHGALSAQVELNGAYGDVFQQTHAPESMLPLALLGARTWRTMPRVEVTPSRIGLVGRNPVVLHPRLLERLVRHLAGPIFFTDQSSPPFAEGEMIAAPAVTLVDDPGLDGLTTSRAFDDEGVPTRRVPLMVRGRLTQRVHRRRSPQRSDRQVGNVWRAAAGAAGPTLAFSSLLMERGDVGFHDMIAAVSRTVLIHEVDEFEVLDPVTSRFACRVRWGVTLERGGESRLLQPGAWRLTGHLFGLPDKPPGLLDDVVLSRELHDTGSAILPYCMAFATIQET
ncbi:MAG: hypothetical protein KC620_22005 [Myxococcales bacterium]|nr:hypothetical protein [Myxococcales bacterium]